LDSWDTHSRCAKCRSHGPNLSRSRTSLCVVLRLDAALLPTQTWKNNEYVQPFVRKENGLSDDEYALVAEAQTSGGLLAAVRSEQVSAVLAALHDAGDEKAAVVGEVVRSLWKETAGKCILK